MSTKFFFNNREIEYPQGKGEHYLRLVNKYYKDSEACILDSKTREQEFLAEITEVLSDDDFDLRNKLNYIALLMETVNFGHCFYPPWIEST